MKMKSFLQKICAAAACVIVLSIFVAMPAIAGRSSKRALQSRAAKQRQVFASGAVGSAVFSPIGFLSGDNSSEIRAVTADGSVAVGASGSGPTPGLEYGRQAVQWTSSGGLVALPGIPYDGTPAFSSFTTASDISASGSWIAYRADPGFPGTPNGRDEAVICNSDFSQVIPLGRLQSPRVSAANQISDDGSVVFGFGNALTTVGQSSVNLIHAFRWTQGTSIQQIAEPSPFNASIPGGRACSADGGVSVGFMYQYDANSHELLVQAYDFTVANGMQPLGNLAGGDHSAALDISADGSTIFGVSTSTAHPATFDANGIWIFNGELVLWTSGGVAPLGVPAGYDIFNNFAGMSADGALLATFAGDSTHAHPDSFFVIQTANKQAFDAYDLLVSAGAGDDISGWSELAPFGISDNGDTLFGIAIDPNGKQQGWVANFPAGYLRNVQTFNASNSSSSVDITAGGFVGRDGDYAASSVTIGTSGTGGSRGVLNGLAGTSGASLTLSGMATLAVDGMLTLNSSGSLNLLGGASVTAAGFNVAAGSTLAVELDAAAETINRFAISGPITLNGQPTLNLILSYTPVRGTIFSILHNTSGQAIQGEFAGVPDKKLITIASTQLRATYSGGTSRQDFVVRVLPAVQMSSIAKTGNGDFVLKGKADPGATVQIQQTSDLRQGFPQPVITVQADATTGEFQFDDTSSAGELKQFYRASYAD